MFLAKAGGGVDVLFNDEVAGMWTNSWVVSPLALATGTYSLLWKDWSDVGTRNNYLALLRQQLGFILTPNHRQTPLPKYILSSTKGRRTHWPLCKRLTVNSRGQRIRPLSAGLGRTGCHFIRLARCVKSLS